MDILEITGTNCGTPRQQWAAERIAGTGTGAGPTRSWAYVASPSNVQPVEADPGFWIALANCWELVRLSRRTPWRIIIGPELTQGGAQISTLLPLAVGSDADSPVGDAEMLGRLKHYLSLNTSELASVLKVGRPTVYAWMQGGPIRPGNRERLALLYRVAQNWWRRAGQPLGAFLQLKRADGKSLLDLLGSDPLDEAGLEPFFKVADQRIRRAAQEKSGRAETYDVLSRRHRFAPVPGGVRDRTLRQFGQGKTKT